MEDVLRSNIMSIFGSEAPNCGVFKFLDDLGNVEGKLVADVEDTSEGHIQKLAFAFTFPCLHPSPKFLPYIVREVGPIGKNANESVVARDEGCFI
jgi:hypothetical protein